MRAVEHKGMHIQPHYHTSRVSILFTSGAEWITSNSVESAKIAIDRAMARLNDELESNSILAHRVKQYAADSTYETSTALTGSL